MSDLNYIDRTQEVKIAGQDSTGLGVNYVSADANGNMLVKDYADGPVSPGTAALVSTLIGGQFNTALPTLTNTQQSAIQLDSSGRLIIRPLTSADVVSAAQSGTWTVQQGTPPWSVVGTLTNNNSSPLANNMGVLGAWAQNTVNSSRYTSNAQVLPIVDIAGNTNVDIQYFNSAAISASNPVIGTLSDGVHTLNQAFSSYGTPPIGTYVLGVNAYVTNAPEISAIYNSTPPTLSNGQLSPLQLDTNGNLKISGTFSAVNLSVSQIAVTSPSYATNVGGAVTTSLPTYVSGQLDALSLTTNGLLRVDGSNATQPISAVSLPLPTGAATNAELITINSTLGSPFQAGGSIGNTTFASTQSGAWTTGRTWTLASGTDSVSAVQSTSPWVTKDQSDGTIGSAVPTIGIQIAAKNTLGNLQAVNMDRNGFINANPNTDKSVFGPLITQTRVQQIEVDFSQTIANNNLTQTTTGTGTISLSNANATIATGTGTTSSASLQTIGNCVYTPGREVYAQFTAAYTIPTSAASTQIAGLYNGVDGLWIGYNGTNFGIASVANGSSTFVASSSFNLDTLSGGANSQFTRGGVPEAVNFTFKNVWRIRFGWLGAAPIYFEILSPDGNWVTFHMIRQPNTSVNPAFQEPSLPITMRVTKTASDTTNLQIITTSWDAGIVDVSAGVDISDSGTITGLNSNIIINTAERSTVVADITGTWSGTLQVQGDVGDGSWNPIYAINTNAIAAQTITANATLIIACAGFSFIRVIATAWTSGTAVVNWNATQGIQAIIAQVVGNIASGSTDTGNPIKVGGVYNSVLPSVASGDRVDLQLDSNGRLLVSSESLPTTASKFSFGSVNTANTNQTAVVQTAYTETTTNSTMTLVSASANDAAAGTGARSVSVTYLDQNMTGPYTVTVNLNGTTAVPVTGSMCYIEKMVVATVGTGLVNAGIITLKTGGGATVGTIAAGINQTLWTHHYVPQGKISYISGFSFGNNATAAGNGGQFILKVSTPTVANTPENQISDFCTVSGADNTVTRNYGSPIQVAGPARITAYVTPYNGAATTQFASFDFIDN